VLLSRQEVSQQRAERLSQFAAPSPAQVTANSRVLIFNI